MTAAALQGAHAAGAAVADCGQDKALSLILCARNDDYMGNVLWRLSTSVCATAESAQRAGVARSLEVLITDWGSEAPLARALPLTTEARALVRFVQVPSALARRLQGDSPFPEVLALNAAARRARGALVGRVDADTMVGERFLRWQAEGGGQRLYFSMRRRVPHALARASHPLPLVDGLVRRWGRLLRVEHEPAWGDYYQNAVGIWMLPRAWWAAGGGYRESMIYWGHMEVEMARRLGRRYPLADLGPLVGHDFYHLEHYDPRQERLTWRRQNAYPEADPGGPLNPNGESWGLADHPLEVVDAEASGGPILPPLAGGPSPAALLRFAAGTFSPALAREHLSSRARGVLRRGQRWIQGGER